MITFIYQSFFKKNVEYLLHKIPQQLSDLQARQLLKNTAMPVTDIAFNVGYTNLRTFNRNFKELNGNSPAQYRKSSKITKYDKAIQENYISG